MRLLPFLIVLPACFATDGTPSGTLDVRGGNLGFVGNVFACTGTWPDATNPCATSWQSSPASYASSSSGQATITLTRTPMPVDGGSSTVTISLALDAQGAVIAASAKESVSGFVGTTETSLATGGWVLPVTSGSAYLGQFEIDFAWGSIQGTYDTQPPTP